MVGDESAIQQTIKECLEEKDDEAYDEASAADQNDKVLNNILANENLLGGPDIMILSHNIPQNLLPWRLNLFVLAPEQYSLT